MILACVPAASVIGPGGEAGMEVVSPMAPGSGVIVANSAASRVTMGADAVFLDAAGVDADAPSLGTAEFAADGDQRHSQRNLLAVRQVDAHRLKVGEF